MYMNVFVSLLGPRSGPSLILDVIHQLTEVVWSSEALPLLGTIILLVEVVYNVVDFLVLVLVQGVLNRGFLLGLALTPERFNLVVALEVLVHLNDVHQVVEFEVKGRLLILVESHLPLHLLHVFLLHVHQKHCFTPLLYHITPFVGAAGEALLVYKLDHFHRHEPESLLQ